MLAGSTLGILALVLTLATWLTRPELDGPQAGCVIAVDAQGSAGAMLTSYRQWLAKQASDCAAEDRGRLSIALVSGETRTGTVTPVTVDLRALKLTGNDVRDAANVRQKIARAVQEADRAILAAPNQHGGTDIVGMLCVAGDLLQGHTPATLVLDTDGMNNKAPYRLSAIPLDDASITTYVKQLKADGQLCDLRGTRVLMYGVGIGAGTGKLSAQRLAGIQRFWEAVVRGTGAELAVYQRNP
ncbi:hypothetical protein ASD62_03380 [Phycicoccus sp. Root563]|nr:hypothetical protein ASD62_03380 [Phycicoccus sp. Root563]